MDLVVGDVAVGGGAPPAVRRDDGLVETVGLVALSVRHLRAVPAVVDDRHVVLPAPVRQAVQGIEDAVARGGRIDEHLDVALREPERLL